MAIRVDSFQLEVGAQQDLHIAQGEDRRYSFSFTPAGAGMPIDFTGMQGAVMSAKDRQGIEVLTRLANALGGTPTVLSFDVFQADTQAQPVMIDRVDITYRDAQGLKTQLMGSSRFFIDRSESEPGDTPTTPPAIPVVFGLRWLGAWSNITAYLVNDAVQYPDPNGGASDALSSFRCRVPNTNVPPLNGMGALSADWQYIAERGADGAVGAVSTIMFPQSTPWATIAALIPPAMVAEITIQLVDDGSNLDWLADSTPSNLDNVTIRGCLRRGPSVLKFMPGFAITGTRLRLRHYVVAEGFTTLSSANGFILDISDQAQLYNSGGVPLFIVPPGGGFTPDLATGAYMAGDAAAPVVSLGQDAIVGGVWQSSAQIDVLSFALAPGAVSATVEPGVDCTVSIGESGNPFAAGVTFAPDFFAGTAAFLPFLDDVPGNWAGSPPTDVQTAIRRIAAMLKFIGGPIG